MQTHRKKLFFWETSKNRFFIHIARYLNLLMTKKNVKNISKNICIFWAYIFISKDMKNALKFAWNHLKTCKMYYLIHFISYFFYQFSQNTRKKLSFPKIFSLRLFQQIHLFITNVSMGFFFGFFSHLFIWNVFHFYENI